MCRIYACGDGCVSSIDESGSPIRREEGSDARCLDLQPEKCVTVSGKKLKVLVTLIWIAFFAVAVWTSYMCAEKYVGGRYAEEVEEHALMEVEYPVFLHTSGTENTVDYVLQPQAKYRTAKVLLVHNGMGLATPSDMRIEYEVIMRGKDYIRYHIFIYRPSEPERACFEYCILRNGTVTTPGYCEDDESTLSWTDARCSAGAEEVGFWKKIFTVYLKQPSTDPHRMFCVARCDHSCGKSLYMMASDDVVYFISDGDKSQTGTPFFNKMLSNADVEVYSVRVGVEPYTVIAPMTFYFYRDGTTRATYGIVDESTDETAVKECIILSMSKHEFFQLWDLCDNDPSTQQPVYVPRSSSTAIPEPTRDVVRDMTDDFGKLTKDEIEDIGDDLHVDLSDFSDIVDKISDSG